MATTRQQALENRIMSSNYYRAVAIANLAIIIVARQLVEIKKKSGYFISTQNRLKLYERDQYTCIYCAKTFTRKELSLDHIVPRKVKVDNSHSNLITACMACNLKKWHHPLDSFICYLNISGVNTTITSKDVIRAAKKAAK